MVLKGGPADGTEWDAAMENWTQRIERAVAELRVNYKARHQTQEETGCQWIPHCTSIDYDKTTGKPYCTSIGYTKKNCKTLTSEPGDVDRDIAEPRVNYKARHQTQEDTGCQWIPHCTSIDYDKTTGKPYCTSIGYTKKNCKTLTSEPGDVDRAIPEMTLEQKKH